MRTITIFGSSLPGEGVPIYSQARRLGKLLAEAGYAVCNGGYAGLMEASARGAREAGGHTIGITCSVWSATVNPWIAEEVRVPSFPDRIMTLIERGDAYIVLPGGTGTLAELALAWEIMNKSSLSRTVGGRKPLIVMVPYWRQVLECLDQEAALGGGAGEPFSRSQRATEIITLVENEREAAEKLLAHFGLVEKDARP